MSFVGSVDVSLDITCPVATQEFRTLPCSLFVTVLQTDMTSFLYLYSLHRFSLAIR